MSDRYIIDIDCVYCKKTNEGILFNQEWGDSFNCEFCEKINYIRTAFKSYKRKE